jgi:HSP20 family molecular chaperone IbpA
MNRFQPIPAAALFGFASGWPADRMPRKGADGYPPYNVELLTRPDGEILRITLAVAGFRAEDLDVQVKDGRLTISGGQPDEAPKTYLHRGIATRRFQRAFVLADGVEVVSADLHNGLLAIDLVRPVRNSDARKIAIGRAGDGPPE